ncbi:MULTISPECIES: hypothetical protein [Actinoallomurus]|uniref:hypothetical protein n=1 Tax=Actinoallomurus TaxID=667113 RepID=UPI002092D2DC|nr:MULTISPECIES: hypothetical protein [Actinoallomurus]MCO5969199.1 hypothetical protein [Actinoallomurus soli]MCO5998723.1 hypothetical protein [Actinoallomurus rhizosphaericola]
MKKLLAAGVAAAALTITGIGTAPVASAKTSHSDVSAASCVYRLKARYNVKIRKSKKISATALGVLPHGKPVCSDKYELGGKYTYKGSCKDRYGWKNHWDHITYKPKGHAKIVGWVPSTCLTWA